jgi:hypothetical protein
MPFTAYPGLIMKRIALLIAIATLASCSSKGPDSGLGNEQAQGMFKEAMSQPPVPQSVMRNGDRLSFMLLQPKTETSPFGFLLQVDASCSTPNANLIYLDGVKRIYFSSPNGQYTPARPIPASQVAALSANPAFQRACAATQAPDWRMLQGSGDEQWVMIDRNSLNSADGKLQFWAAFDSPLIGHDQPYNAPYAQKRERYSVDCAAQTFSLLAGYDLDERNVVTDGGVFFEPKTYSVKGSDSDYQRVFDAACGKPEALAQLPAFKPRAKGAVPVNMPSVQAPALSAVKQLNLPVPAKTLKHLVETGTATLNGKSAEFTEEIFLSQDKVSGQLAVRFKGDTYEGQAVSFRGLTELAHQTVHSGAAPMVDTLSLSGISFSGDWKKMPLGSVLGYVTEGKMSNTAVGAYGKERQAYECRVEQQVPASQINSSLSGQAKKLRCAHQGDSLQRIETVYFLEDYGYFFRAGMDPNDAFYDRRVLKVAE